ncbi:MAG: EI24 domain-containing protein [Ignavibacteria bacterium]|jgi:CysZ protein
MKDFFFGFTYPIRCINIFLKNPKIIAYSLVPFIINVIIYGTIFVFSYKWIIGFSGNVTGAKEVYSTWWQELLNILLLFVSFFILLIICYLAFITLSSIITAPFNEKISCLVEEVFTKNKVKYDIGFWKDAWLSIKAELLKILFYLVILIPILLLNLIPFIGSIFSTVFGILFSFFYNALDFLDYPMTRKYFNLRKKIKIVISKKLLSIGFGCCVFLIMFLPFLNVLLKSVCVTAGTALFFEKEYCKEILIKQN